MNTYVEDSALDDADPTNDKTDAQELSDSNVDDGDRNEACLEDAGLVVAGSDLITHAQSPPQESPQH